MVIMKNPVILVPVIAMLAAPALACDLKVAAAWIRTAPGNATTLAGYAVLTNTGSKVLSVASLQSAAFDRVEMHESLTENGIARMRPINKLEFSAGGKQTFAPGGKHFMLINPKAALRGGDVVAVRIKDSDGCETTASFMVSAVPPTVAEMDHSTMDHSTMDHSSMDHSKMNGSSSAQ
jgi:periplasmic copper chaperone A